MSQKISINWPSDVAHELRQMAKRHDRSISDQAVFIVHDWMTHLGFKLKPFRPKPRKPLKGAHRRLAELHAGGNEA